MIWSFALVAGLAVLFPLSLARSSKEAGDVRISMAIPEYSDAFSHFPGERTVRYGTGEDRFPVVIENRSRRPIELFADGNSWGDPTLTFEIVGADGKRVIARKVVLMYSANAPVTVRLAPGECWVRDVFYSLPAWQGFPDTSRRGPQKVTMRAILEQAPAGMKRDPALWSGRAVSVLMTVKWSGRPSGSATRR